MVFIYTAGDMGLWGVAVLIVFLMPKCSDAVNKIRPCCVAVISNPTVCDVFLAVMRCLTIKNCDKTFCKNILKFVDDVSTFG